MAMGHLMLGLLGGLLAFVAALALGQPAWIALLLYTGLGNLVIAGSVLLDALLGQARNPPGPPRRTMRPAPLRRLDLQPLRVRP